MTLKSTHDVIKGYTAGEKMRATLLMLLSLKFFNMIYDNINIFCRLKQICLNYMHKKCCEAT